MTTAQAPELSTYRWSSHDEADRFAVEDPATIEVITLVQGGGSAEVTTAVEAAHRAFQAGWRWRPPERHQLPDLRGTLAMLGEELLDVIFRFPDHVWVFLHDFPALTGKNAETFRQRRRSYEQRVENVFKQGVESGDFRLLDTRLAVAAWLGMHNYMYLSLRAGGRFSVKGVAKSFADIFVWGIATRE